MKDAPGRKAAIPNVIDMLEDSGLALETVRFARGVEILEEGADGDFMLVIKSGRVGILAKNRRIAEIGTGEFVGETALIDNKPRSATAIALEPTEAIRIDRKTFIQLRQENLQFVNEIMTALASRIRQATGIMADTLPEAKTKDEPPAIKNPKPQASEVKW